jgi:hypothetical protein
MATPIPFRIPDANRAAGEKLWPVLFASNFQIPARVFSSVHGSLPGESLVRSFT